MKKMEVKQLTIDDLNTLYEKHVNANSEEQKELWANESDENKALLSILKQTKLTNYKVITNKLVVDDIWAREVEIINYGFKKYDIKEFILKDRSTQAMDILITFIRLGWEVVGVEDWAINEKYDWTKKERYYEPYCGIVLKRKENK